MKTIIFTVTNDLTYDQRMIRICSSLARNGYEVLLVGRLLSDSVALNPAPFRQKRISCIFREGFLFYADYNIRLFFYLLFKKADLICAIDLDTIIPCRIVSGIKNIPRVYDAHELFCEMKEIVSKPAIYRFWKRIEKWMVPAYKYGYTVNEPIAKAFHKMYGVNYSVIRNLPVLTPLDIPRKPEKYILYQGAVNEGRSFETLIPAMHSVNARLIICGDGNFMQQVKRLVALHRLENKVIFAGKLKPDDLKKYTLNAYIGVTIFEGTGLSNYYSLANRFFDYMHAGVPQICVNFPVYKQIVSEFPFALLVDDTSSEKLSDELNTLLNDEGLYLQLQANCLTAREKLNWNEEEKKLIGFHQNIFSG